MSSKRRCINVIMNLIVGLTTIWFLLYTFMWRSDINFKGLIVI